jgi:hypothetical protein
MKKQKEKTVTRNKAVDITTFFENIFMIKLYLSFRKIQP